MNFDSDLRAPLDFTKPRSKTKLLVCPNCKIGRHQSVDCISLICSGCGKYFRAEDSLIESEMDSVLKSEKIIDKEFTKRKAEMEKKAYAWKVEQEAKGNLGTRSHEPGLEKRKW